MFEAAEVGHKLSKGEYRKIEPKLRAELLEAQFALSKNGRFPVIILISGVRGAGTGAGRRGLAVHALRVRHGRRGLDR